jgi:hypothetical protein
MRIRTTFALWLILLWSAATCLHAQQPAKDINPVPLEHPQPFTSIRSADVADLLTRLRAAIEAAGFTVTRTDNNRLLIEGRRAEAAPSRDYDRVLVWLERGPVEPMVNFDLYLAYGRYEEIWARRRDIYRVVVDQRFEEERIGAAL